MPDPEIAYPAYIPSLALSGRRPHVEFVVYGLAAPAGSKTIGKTKGGQMFVRDSSGNRGKDWRVAVGQAAGIAMMGHPLMEGPLRLILQFFTPRPRSHYGTGRNAELVKESAPEYPIVKPDLTKLTRAVEDALTGIVWRDDAQVICQVLYKHYGEPARVLVVVEQV